MKLKKRYFLLPTIATLFLFLLYSTYGEVKNKTISEFNTQQMILSMQAAGGIQDYFGSYHRDLTYLAGIDEIVLFGDQGRELMEKYYRVNSGEISAITRMDALGRIIHTSPFNVKAIGADISSQHHVQEVMKTHVPIVSEVFRAVQGYPAVAYHVPILVNGSFRGSLAVLVPFENIAKKYLENIKAGQEGYAFMTSRKGAMLYSHDGDYSGKTVFQVYKGSPEMIAMAGEMIKGGSGTAVYSHADPGGNYSTLHQHHVVYTPVKLGNTFWSIAVATPESVVLSTMDGFRDRLLSIITVLLGIGFFCSYYFFRALVILKEEKKRRKAEAELKRSEEKYRQLADLLPLCVFEMDESGNVTLANRIALELFQYTRAELKSGIKGVDLIVPEQRKRILKGFDEIMQGRDLGGAEYRLLKKDLTSFTGLIYTSAIVHDGVTAGLRGVIVDLTEQIRNRESLKEARETFLTVLDSIDASIYVADLSTHEILFVNRRMKDHFKTNLVGKICHEVFRNLDDPCKQCNNEDLLDDMGQPTGVHVWEGENLITRKYHVNYDRAIRWVDGRFVRLQISMDITHMKELEREQRKIEIQLHQAKKMEAIGTLAGGIAHDFNNLLMGIQGRTTMMLADAKPSHPFWEHLNGIIDHVKSASDLTKQLLGFARGGKYEVRPTDLNELIKHQTRMFGRAKKEIRIRGKYDKSLWPVAIDPGQIDQVILNLFVNSWQAMPNGGNLYVQTQNVQLKDEQTHPYDLKSGRYVEVAVTDTGIGMDEATRQRIFDPFFTTKEMGRGTGMGLASVYGIIKNHGGFIEVDSEKGKGSTFTFYLPPTDAKVESVQAAQPIETVVGDETGTILLVDDEELIQSVGNEMLRKLGYEVILASGGLDALAKYEKYRSRIDLVILDMIMPDMGGGETYDRLKAMHPDIRVLLSSGYSIDGQASEILERGCNGFIQKPFSLNQLSRKIKKILSSTSG